MASRMKKRGEGVAKASSEGEGATIGMLTSHIKNKIARSEAYQHLKKIKKVREEARLNKSPPMLDRCLELHGTVPMAHVASRLHIEL